MVNNCAESLLKSKPTSETNRYRQPLSAAEDSLITKPDFVKVTADSPQSLKRQRKFWRRKCVVCCLCCFIFVILVLVTFLIFLAFCDCAPLVAAVASKVFESASKHPASYNLPGMKFYAKRLI